MFRLTGGIHLITSAWKARGQCSVQGFSSGPEGLPDAAGAISVGSRRARNRSERSVRKKRAVAQDGFEHFGDERFPLLWLYLLVETSHARRERALLLIAVLSFVAEERPMPIGAVPG